jgi:hypothetical protein
LRAITSPSERAKLWTISLASFASGIADAVSLSHLGHRSSDHKRRHVNPCGRRRRHRSHWFGRTQLRRHQAADRLWSRCVGQNRYRHRARHRTTVLRSFIDAPWGVSSAESPGAIQQVAMANTQVAGAYALTATSLVSAAINICVLAIAAIAASPVGAAAVGAMAVIVGVAMRPWTSRSRHVGHKRQSVARKWRRSSPTSWPPLDR